ncbi:hypothetical protein [Streptomyces telluris]|uniref:Uncharacterized protein n=1 Tax=Streptomyces telluris TaxID=2720021 RepID=A0A9X2LNG2_9ACTN|nr:hypothetical protein [Streptomyces telluris]MCQ8774408.1 hypothetical protein [Streptomyces telluris]
MDDLFDLDVEEIAAPALEGVPGEAGVALVTSNECLTGTGCIC